MNISFNGLKHSCIVEIIIRVFFFIVYIQLEYATPFVRKIHLDELWMYKYPRTDSYIPITVLVPVVLLVPSSIFIVLYCFKRDKTDLNQTFLAFSLALGLNGIITDILKLIVGRPRPDFFYRCFPDGKTSLEEQDVIDIASLCTGDVAEIIEGRKSFPSGHSSLSFCSFGFLCLWICGKLKVFSHRRGSGWRLLPVIITILIPLVISLSRTCDYHHHWQDVVVGSLLGFVIAYLCYRHYFPCLNSPYSHLSYLTMPSSLPRLFSDINDEQFITWLKNKIHSESLKPDITINKDFESGTWTQF